MEVLIKKEKPAFADFYATHYDRVVRYISNKLGNYHDAQDMAGDIFLYCYNNYDSYDPVKSAPTTWLYLIVNSRIKNHYRDAKTCVDLETVAGVLPEDGVDLDLCVYLEQLRNRMANEIARLPERQQKIVRMRYFEQRSGKEIAEVMNMTQVNVRVTLSRALNTLQTHCKDLLEGEN
jgi:RNA polymerase sigma-70 factor (ECF subfamily)